MKTRIGTGIVLALLLWAPQAAFAELSGFTLNSIEAAGTLESIDDRLKDDQQISYVDCLAYLGDCIPECDGLTCGEDGCGGSCGECLDSFSCFEGNCVSCLPDCVDKECGEDGCGGSCGDCFEGYGDGWSCGEDGLCFECVPNCTDKECGDDTCGGFCGVDVGEGGCPEGDACVEGLCIYSPECGDGFCETGAGEACDICPEDCGCACGEACESGVCTYIACVAKECGDDGCGVSCGECEDGFTCTEGMCEASRGGKEDDITGVVEDAWIKVKFSVDGTYKGLNYTAAAGSCTSSDGLDGCGTDTNSNCRCVTGHRNVTLSSNVNVELTMDLRDLIPDGCVFGEDGESALYIFIEDPYGLTQDATVMQEVKFQWDFDPPYVPTTITLEGGEQNIKVAWEDEVNSSGTVEYNVYWSTDSADLYDDDAGWITAADSKTGLTATSYQITGLENGFNYHVAITAEDEVGNESEVSAFQTGSPVAVDDFWEYYNSNGGGEEGGFCFVATATYGTYMAPAVLTLRKFRNQALLTTAWGRSLVDFYYVNSPALARTIAGSPVLRAVSRVLLAPVVAGAWLAVEATLVHKVAVLMLLLVGAVALRRRRKALQAQGRVS